MNPSRPQLPAPFPSPMEQSWHLLTVLIRTGRPARPHELASRSELYSSDLVEFLCMIPGSPLLLTGDGFVTVSESAFAAFGGFLSGAAALARTPGVSVSDRRKDWVDLRLMYTRKRKVGSVGPRAKRRLLLPPDNVEEELGRDGLQIGSSHVKAWKLQESVAENIAKDSLSVGTSSMGLNRDVVLTPSLSNPNMLRSIFGLDRDLGGRVDDSEKVCSDRQAIILKKGLPTLSGSEYGSLEFELNAAIFEVVNITRPVMNEADREPALLDIANEKPTLWMEAMGEDSCILSAAPLAVRYEEMPSANFPREGNENNMPCIDNDLQIGHAAGFEQNGIATEHYCQNGEVFSAVSLSTEPATETMLFEKPEVTGGIVSNVGLQCSVGDFENRTNDTFPRQEQSEKEDKCTTTKKKMKRVQNINMPLKENRKEDLSRICKSKSESKLLPNFESFVIEEEEGSGGYGTVYRARRKEDGKIFAVKCPHPNAHSHHVHNELKMLERFGGRNFVIKYEGSFSTGHSEYFALEHVKHDRPEVLKKEIDVFELQWYGYCMFRALASLHKQGVVHRDVKPGNFLFSRELNKGYLIDFNLASDLHQKLSRRSRSGTTSKVNITTVSLSSSRPVLLGTADVLNNIGNEAINNSRKLIPKHMKNGKDHRDTFRNISSSSKFGSQAADSGLTSVKEPTSTKTQSADRSKHPMPYKGRKELMSYVHEAMQSPDHRVLSGPTTQRKRIAAPLGEKRGRLVIPTPMPLHCGGNAVAGAGMIGRGNGKHKREGPCVGTKGFRAPEVLFKSSYQGCKIDVWSAGVTLLYLIIGKMPFGGDPEQNIKDIAKLRGSEGLWEVAKLHDRECSYPEDLFDVQSLQSTELRDWCATNTKRSEFLEQVPGSLFDLIDRCLAVNQRVRITAEDALEHKFFAPCHESLRKQRLLRRIAGSESGSQTL